MGRYVQSSYELGFYDIKQFYPLLFYGHETDVGHER